MPANYKGCTVYKDPQKETYPPLLCDKQELRNMMKRLFEQMGTMINLTAMLIKLK
jgi:hypothetical protein